MSDKDDLSWLWTSMSWPDDGQPTILCSMSKPDNVFFIGRRWPSKLAHGFAQGGTSKGMEMEGTMSSRKHPQPIHKHWIWWERLSCWFSMSLWQTSYWGDEWIVRRPCKMQRTTTKRQLRCVCARKASPFGMSTCTWECTQHRCYLTFGESLSLGIHFEGGRHNFEHELYATLH